MPVLCAGEIVSFSIQTQLRGLIFVAWALRAAHTLSLFLVSVLRASEIVSLQLRDLIFVAHTLHVLDALLLYKATNLPSNRHNVVQVSNTLWTSSHADVLVDILVLHAPRMAPVAWRARKSMGARPAPARLAGSVRPICPSSKRLPQVPDIRTFQ